MIYDKLCFLGSFWLTIVAGSTGDNRVWAEHTHSPTLLSSYLYLLHVCLLVVIPYRDFFFTSRDKVVWRLIRRGNLIDKELMIEINYNANRNHHFV